MPKFTLRPLRQPDRAWVRHIMLSEWGAETVVVHQTVYHPAELPGFIAQLGRQKVGLLTYHIAGQACEIVTLNSWREGLGIGTALLEAAKQAGRKRKCQRVWLITTNDNLHALRFYQKHGFVICAFHINAIAEDRRLKPEIPLTGLDGIPIRDEIELEIKIPACTA